MKAYQVYDGLRSMSMGMRPTNETGERKFKCYCSECGCPVFSDKFPSERKECPHCHAEFAPDRLMKYEAWTAELNHVGYTQQECGREQ